jgi:KipI family sensor histidine kinase inhibitor
VVPFGDRALLMETTDVAAAHALSAAIIAGRAAGTAPDGIDEVVVGFASVAVVLDPDPDVADSGTVADWLGRLGPGAPADHRVRVTHTLPVVFDGADLDEVAGLLGLSPDQVVDLVVGADLEVAFVGFAPGFPYLTGLPEPLAGLPRRATPRTQVPVGSMAVAGGFAAVYPRATPGGWHVLGTSSEALFDPHVPPYSLVGPGDGVRFVAVDRAAPTALPTGAARPPLRAVGSRFLEVVEPGPRSLVQDTGRRGTSGIGVPTAGAADPRAHALVNLLLGNAPDAATVECTASGPSMRMAGGGHVAVVGAGRDATEVHVDGHPVSDGSVVPVADGQMLSIGPVRHGLRAYLGVAGGVDGPVLLGSRSSDLLSGLGPGPLQIGDRLAIGAPGRMRGRLDAGASRGPGPVRVRVMPGPHPDAAATLDRFVAITWRVGSGSDRVGVRLEAADGMPLPAVTPRPSTPMVTGAVQLPPDGHPIVLLPDHATVGGYPVIACVISADLGSFGQLRPGDEVAFGVVDHATAGRALRQTRADLAGRVSGWFPTVAGT